MNTTKSALSLIWIFVTVNYIFCDVFTLFHGPSLSNLMQGSVGGMEITQTFLLSFAVILELPMAMILGARFLPTRINRIANMAVALIMTVVQAGSLFSGDSTLHYYFFSVIEIATTLAIFYIALRWRETDESPAGSTI